MPEFFDPDADRKPKRKRAPPELGLPMLRDAARRHLQRFWPSVLQLRRVLMRRVDASVGWHVPPAERDAARARGAVLVEEVIAELLAEGALDDARFARGWVEDLHRKGIARRAIRARLADKGIAAELVAAALDGLEEDLPEPELVRACAYVRRRRLGPARPPQRRPADADARRQQRQKDLAAVCRAGFGFSVAQQVIDCEDLDTLLDRADGGAGSTW